MSCTDDFNCTGTLVCYNDVPWDERESFCDCSTFYGWTGSNCDEYGPTAVFMISLATILLVFVCIGLCFACMDLRVAVRNKNARVLNKGNITLILSTATLVFSLTFLVAVIDSIRNPELNTGKFESNAVPEKLAKNSLIERLGGMLACMFSVLASLNVSLVWLEVSNKIQKLAMNPKSSRFYERVVYSFQLGFVVVTLVAIISGAFFIAFMIALPYVLGLGGTFIVGRQRFAAILDKSDANRTNSGFQELATQVRLTSFGVIVSMSVFFICGLAYSVLSYFDWRIYSPKDSIAAPSALLLLSFGAIIVWNTVIFWYSHQRFNVIRSKIGTTATLTVNPKQPTETLMVASDLNSVTSI